MTMPPIVTTTDHRALIPVLNALAEAAGREILAIYATDFEIQTKDDRSPVTAADLRADAVILDGLRTHAPDIAVISEESINQGIISDLASAPFFLVDPLDGTREFINRNGEFTVNIALIENATPVLGVVHLPVFGTTYWADTMAYRQRQGETPEPIQCRQPPGAGLTAIISRSHHDHRTRDYLKQINIAESLVSGSSLKLCKIAEGNADLYPRFGRTMEWDIAAGHAILIAAGGSIRTLDETPLRYGKPGFYNPDFIACGAISERTQGTSKNPNRIGHIEKPQRDGGLGEGT